MSGRSAPLTRVALTAGVALLVSLTLIAALGLFAACLPRGHVDVPAQSRAGTDLAALLPGVTLARAGGADADDGNLLGDNPAPADDNSRWDAQLASATRTVPHLNDVAQRVRYNGVYFEIDVEVHTADGIEHGGVPVVWKMIRAHTPLTDGAYYAQVYTSRGRSIGRQVPNLGPEVILPEAFTPELTPDIFDLFAPSFIMWNVNFDGWSQGMAEAWQKEMAIHVARAWTPEYVGGVAVASAQASIRASRITGQAALGAAAVPNAVSATRACSGGRCPCFVAGTPVATADGPVAIERVGVGQRALPASPACADFTADDAAALAKYELQIRTTDGDIFVIELLRPHNWPHAPGAPGARPGDTVHVELDEMNVRGPALVLSRDPHPNIDMDSTRGCAVTGTIRHTATTLSVLRLADDDEPIIATPWHLMYSHTRDDWIAIEDLATGELLRTADGTVAVESVIELRDQHEPVFNLEVAGSHRYLVHERRVLTHNTYGAARGGGGTAGSGAAAAAAGRAGGTTAQLTAAARRAHATAGSGSGPVHGTRVHAAFRAEVEAMGRSDLSTEVSYLNGRIVPYGTKGAVRLDVVEGPLHAPRAVYDLKTGVARLRPARINRIRHHLPRGGSIPIVEIR